MPVTSCEYDLFGERHLQGSLRDVLRHVLPELNRRNPEGLREIAESGWYDWLHWRGGKPFHLRQRYLDILKLDPDLWANVRWANQENLERTCRELVRRLGYPVRDFSVVRFRTEPKALWRHPSIPSAPQLPKPARRTTPPLA